MELKIKRIIRKLIVGIEIILVTIAGTFGALTKDILKDNSLELPQKVEGVVHLGFLGGMITGGVVGYLIDGSITTAFLAGYAGTSVIENLLVSKSEKIEKKPLSIKDKIRQIAQKEKVDPELAIRVAKYESGLNPKAVNVNKNGSRDRGLYQINDRWHPNVSDKEAFDPEFAIKFFCKAVKEGKLNWWNATKKYWDRG